jgi:hypothetical protein
MVQVMYMGDMVMGHEQQLINKMNNKFKLKLSFLLILVALPFIFSYLVLFNTIELSEYPIIFASIITLAWLVAIILNYIHYIESEFHAKFNSLKSAIISISITIILVAIYDSFFPGFEEMTFCRNLNFFILLKYNALLCLFKQIGYFYYVISSAYFAVIVFFGATSYFRNKLK